MDGSEKTSKSNIPTILSSTVKLVTFAPPAVYVMDGVGKILSKE